MTTRISCRALWAVAPIALFGLFTSACQSPTVGSGAAGAAASGARLTGTVTYRERMALPPTAQVIVRLEDVSRADVPATVLASATIATGGLQVPIPFELAYDAERLDPRGRYGVRAEIRDAAGALLFTTTTQHAVLGAGAVNADVVILVERAVAAAAPREVPPAEREVGRTFVFDCDGGVSFTVRTGPGEVALWTPPSLGGRYSVLSQTAAASGSRYAEGDTVFWDHGEEAMFEVAGQRYSGCRSNPAQVPWADAARRGVAFRALGNEPAWNLEIGPDRQLVLGTELGQRRTAARHLEPVVDGARTTYRAANDGQGPTVVVERRACNDTMSGELFEAAVTVTFESARLHGCGRWL